MAAVAAASASQDGSKIGIVTNLSRGTYSGSGANSSYTADTVTILATDGRTYSYQWTTDYFKLGNLVQVVISSEDGSVSLKRLSETGKLSARCPPTPPNWAVIPSQTAWRSWTPMRAPA